jgi:hypothetical protein
MWRFHHSARTARKRATAKTNRKRTEGYFGMFRAGKIAAKILPRAQHSKPFIDRQINNGSKSTTIASKSS